MIATVESDEANAPHKHVSFDEGRNQVTEVPRVPLEVKPDLWLSRMQIRQNKVMVQTELMMERTRELVKAKLVEEVVIDESDPDGLVKQVKALQQKLDEIMSGSKEQILEFLKTKFNWIVDSTDYWKDLPPSIQQAATTLGYTQQLWDEFSQQLDVFDKPWQQLTVDQRNAAETLGYNEITWNGSLDVTDAAVTPEAPERAMKQPTVIEEEEEDIGMTTDADMAGPTYDWDENDSPSDDSTEEGGEDMLSPSDDSDEDKEMEGGYDWANAGPEEDGSMASSPPGQAHGASIDAYKAKYFPIKQPETERKEPDVDEDEFLSNFLVDDHDSKMTNSLQERYVPSDDEFEFDIEDGENDGNQEIKEKSNQKLGETKESLATPASPQYDEEQARETSPLLPSTKNSAKDNGGTGLTRRGHHLGGTGPALAIPFGETDSRSGQVHQAKRQYSNLVRPGLLALALGLTLVWLVVRGF